MAPPPRLVALFSALSLVFALGCAKELATPPSPAGDPCQTLDDCAPPDAPVCGSLRACVDGVCEATPSIYRPCP